MFKKTIFLLSVIFLVLLFGRSLVDTRLESEFTEESLLKKQIGQMIMVGFRGTETSDASSIIEDIQGIKIGGVILFDFDVPSKSFPRNIIDQEQVKELISELQEHSSVPLFIAVDVEGGKVNRLKSFVEFVSPEELEDYKSTRKEAFKISQELKGLGFNMNFAPVVDVNINPNNPVIGSLGRSFSSDYREVALHAQAFIEGHKDIIAVVKHFSGHGSSSKDSHLEMVDVTETYQQEELFPYQELQQKGLLKAVMTAHIFNRNVDENYPVTLSSKFLNMLREEMGFEGVIISDDMQMKAITDYYGKEEAIIKAINAGCDILLFSNNSSEYEEDLAYEVQQIIYQAVKDKKISQERIKEAYSRIIKLKSNL